MPILTMRLLSEEFRSGTFSLLLSAPVSMAQITLGKYLGLLGFLGLHYLLVGAFSPYKWTGFVGGGLLTLALVLFLVGMVGDMLNRHRMYLEELLYRERERSPDG